MLLWFCFFFQAEDGIRDLVRSRGLGDVYKRQPRSWATSARRPLPRSGNVPRSSSPHTALPSRPCSPTTAPATDHGCGPRHSASGSSTVAPGPTAHRPTARSNASTGPCWRNGPTPVSYTHLRAHETVLDLVCRLLLEKKKHTPIQNRHTNTHTTNTQKQRHTHKQLQHE